ncbi:GGDEF domain-containing protein, partial [Omnitrophica bacterium]|nr:GGDEF domain-containing protein [Candidatus Omnitrophota bacterium]
LGLSLVHFVFERILSRRWLQAREKSSMDLLTGGLNRPCFEEIVEEEMRRCNRYHVPLTLCFVDLDDFRSYNESFGRTKGDDLLQKFSDALRGAVRFTDTVARYESDEFCILLPHTDLVRAEKFVIRVLGIIRDQIDCGFCAGLTSFKPGENKTHFIMRARMALQHAKSEGKQRVRCIIGDDNSQTVVHF